MLSEENFKTIAIAKDKGKVRCHIALKIIKSLKANLELSFPV
jgi:hypothetical protein